MAGRYACIDRSEKLPGSRAMVRWRWEWRGVCIARLLAMEDGYKGELSDGKEPLFSSVVLGRRDGGREKKGGAKQREKTSKAKNLFPSARTALL